MTETAQSFARNPKTQAEMHELSNQDKNLQSIAKGVFLIMGYCRKTKTTRH